MSESDATLPPNVRPRVNTRGAPLAIDRRTTPRRSKRASHNIYRDKRRMLSHTQRAAVIAAAAADQSVASFHNDAEPLLSPRHTAAKQIGGARSEESGGDESEDVFVVPTTAKPSVVTFRVPSASTSPQPYANIDRTVRSAATVQSGAQMNARVQVLPERWKQFQRDTPREFMAGNKPPWAPRISNSAHKKMITWKVMEMYDYDHLRTMDWYVFLEEVVGAVTTDGDVSLFAGTQVTSASTRSVAPSRSGDRGGGVLPGGMSIVDMSALGQLTTAGMPSPLAQFHGGVGQSSLVRPVVVSPTLDDILHAPPPQRMPTDLDRIAALAAGRAGPTPADLAQLAQRSFADATEAPAATLNRDDSIAAVISNAVQQAAHGSGTPLAQSGARYAETRRFFDAMHTPEWFDMSDAPDAVQQRRKERLDAQHAIPWMYRPLAVGRFLLSPTYTRLVMRAYTDIMLLTDPQSQRPIKCLIRGTPLSEFMRQRADRSTSALVRSLFIDLIAEHYFILRNKRGAGNRYEHDIVRLTQSANGIVAKLRIFFRYDKVRREFYDARSRLTALPSYYRFGTFADH